METTWTKHAQRVVDTREDMISIMRDALVQIAQNRSDRGKAALTRREMQTTARRALVASGYPSWSQPIRSKISTTMEFAPCKCGSGKTWQECCR